MLSPQDLELLTAHVDGELTRRQRRHVNRLLDHSGEARELLRRLEADALRLRQLPTLQAPPDFAAAVVDRIVHRQRLPFSRASRQLADSRPFSPWVGLTAAAAVLLLIGAGSFLLHSDDDTAAEQDRLAQVDKTKRKTPRRELDERSTPEADGHEEGLSPNVPTPPEVPKDKGAPVTPQTVPQPNNPPKETTTERGDRTVLTSPKNDYAGKFEQIDLALPTVWKLHELDQGDAGPKLLSELRTGPAFRVELLARDATRGFERLRAALLGHKVQLHFDPAVPPRLKKPLYTTDYAVFVENVLPEDLFGALRDAGVADREAAAKKPGEMRFDGPLVVKNLATIDRKELTTLLGVDPVATRPARPGRQGVDIRQPLPELTASQVANALDGKGVPRPGPAPEVTGYVTLLLGNRSRPPELKRFLEGRRPAHPGTVQVFLVVRNLGG
jgi:hypothetical protein